MIICDASPIINLQAAHVNNQCSRSEFAHTGLVGTNWLPEPIAALPLLMCGKSVTCRIRLLFSFAAAPLLMCGKSQAILRLFERAYTFAAAPLLMCGKSQAILRLFERAYTFAAAPLLMCGKSVTCRIQLLFSFAAAPLAWRHSRT